MAIILNLRDNQTDLGYMIRELIDSGNLQSWEYDLEGDFTLTSLQWNNKAWFRYRDMDNQNNYVGFGLIGRRNSIMSRSLYAVYHAKFLEMLLSFFDRNITDLQITPMKHEIDSF